MLRRFSHFGFVLGAFFCLSGSAAIAQTSAAEPAAANLRDFDFVVEKITTNYAGYDTRVTEANRAQLTAHTAAVRERAVAASEDELAALLREWVGFFQDRHIGIAHFTSTAAATPPRAAAPPRLEWSEASVRRELASLGRRRSPIEESGASTATATDLPCSARSREQAASPPSFSAAGLKPGRRDW